MGKFLLAVMGVLVLAVTCSGGGSPSAGGSGGGAAAHPHAGARGACQLFIERQLHDPRSAEWVDQPDWTVVDNADGSLSVGARYRAKNGLGAVRLAYTTCVIRKEGGNWRLESLARMQ